MRLMQQQLKQIENTAQDDFSLLEELGASYFSTEELYFLKGQAEVKKDLFSKMQTVVLFLGLGIPVSVALSFILGVSGFHYLAKTCLLLPPITTFLFFCGLAFIQFFFRGRAHSETVESLLKKAIKQREKRKTQTK